MGLGKVVANSARVILPIDSSIQEGSDYPAYRESLYTDESKLRLDPNDPPVRFTIRQLDDAQKDAVFAAGSRRQDAKMAIRCGLRSMDGYVLRRADGVEVKHHQIKFEDQGELGNIISEKWLSEFNFPIDQLIALHVVIDNFSEASLPLSKPSVPEPGPPNASIEASDG